MTMPIRPREVEDAQAEVAEAEALVDALEERIRDGDDSVSPDELEKANSLVRFAKLRVDAGHRKARAAAREEAEREVEAAVKAVEEFFAQLEDLEPLERKAAAALKEYLDACQGQLQRGASTGERLSVANSHAAELEVPGTKDPGRSVRATGGRDSLTLVKDGEHQRWMRDRNTMPYVLARLSDAVGVRLRKA